jgi:hypothetical protein
VVSRGVQVHHERAVGVVDRPACGGPQVVDLDLEHRPEPGAVGVLQEVGGLGEPGVPAGVPGGQHVGLIPPGEQLGSVALAERVLSCRLG